MVEASESAKSTRDLVSGAGGLNQLSNHQRGKQAKRTGQDKPGAGGGSGLKCGFCRWGPHDRSYCLVKESDCTTCGKKGHFAAKCKQKGAGKAKGKLSEVKDTGKDVAEAACNMIKVISLDYFGIASGCLRWTTGVDVVYYFKSWGYPAPPPTEVVGGGVHLSLSHRGIFRGTRCIINQFSH